MPRLVYHYDFQQPDNTINVSVDTDFAGCNTTRRSTSGSAVMIGTCCVTHSSKNRPQSRSVLSKHNCTELLCVALGIQSLMRDTGWSATIVVHSDATAAIEIERREGPGKIHHLDDTDLWIHDKIRGEHIQVGKLSEQRIWPMH